MKKFIYAMILAIAYWFSPSESISEVLLSKIVVEESKDGIVVVEVKNNLSAVKAGLKKNDIIEEIDGEKIENLENYAEKAKRIRDIVNLRVKRGNIAFDITIKPYNISVDIPLNEKELFFVHKTTVTKADIFFKDGMIFMNEGLKEEALDNFKMATDLYEEALHNEYMLKEDLIAIRENLKKMSKQLNSSDDMSSETEDVSGISAITPAEFPTSKELGATTVRQIAKVDQHKPTPKPELVTTPTPFVNKLDLKKAEKDEYWIIETATILLRNPELYGNGSKLLGNLVGGLSSGTKVKIFGTKSTANGNIWIKVEVYNNKKEIYARGWILTDTVGNARQIENL